ncbi:MAG: TonB-dependent receptor [Bacteroidales bacterium]|nr:TonB-dependent receptor [Bacteroidales bacterium]
MWEYISGINDYSAKTDFDYFISSSHSLKFGAGYTYHRFIPGTNDFDYQGADYAEMIDTVFGDPDLRAHEISVYLEDDMKITNKLKANVGVHASAFNVRQKIICLFSPGFQVVI